VDGGYDRCNNVPERTGDQDVGESVKKCRERAVLPRRVRELAGAHLVRPAADRDGANPRKIGFQGSA
jgi:hypothetical protein